VTLLRDRRGVTAIDFAVSISLVLMLLFTVFDLGMLYLAQQTLNYGVAAAVRYAVVNSTGANAGNVTSSLRGAVTPLLGAAAANQCQVTVTFTPGSSPGNSVTVVANFAWKPLTGLEFIPAVTLTSRATLTIQH
jgi:Flp pilus assembly protein TadG